MTSKRQPDDYNWYCEQISRTARAMFDVQQQQTKGVTLCQT